MAPSRAVAAQSPVPPCRMAVCLPAPLPTREQKVNTPSTAAAFVRTSSLRVHLCTARPGAEVGLGWHA
jgi:hypothetical protein